MPQTLSDYTPAKVWEWNTENGGRFANINRPTAGATHDKDRPVGNHPMQLYSLATPNGVKVTVMLEELLALGHEGAEYDAWLIKINEGDQFSSGFVEANPNSKIPALFDHSTPEPTRAGRRVSGEGEESWLEAVSKPSGVPILRSPRSKMGLSPSPRTFFYTLLLDPSSISL